PDVVELGYGVVLEALHDVAEVDADVLQRVDHLPRLTVVVLDRLRGRAAVVREGTQRGLGHGVDHTRGDQLGYVAGVGIGGGLDRRRRPQRPLRAGPGVAQRGPPRRGEHALVVLVDQPRGRDRRAPPHRARLAGPDLVQPGVDLGVDTGDEQRGYRPDLRQVAAGPAGLLQAVQERVHDRVVAFHGEDQRDVDADPLGQAGGDRGQALPGGG